MRLDPLHHGVQRIAAERGIVRCGYGGLSRLRLHPHRTPAPERGFIVRPPIARPAGAEALAGEKIGGLMRADGISPKALDVKTDVRESVVGNADAGRVLA